MPKRDKAGPYLLKVRTIETKTYIVPSATSESDALKLLSNNSDRIHEIDSPTLRETMAVSVTPLIDRAPQWALTAIEEILKNGVATRRGDNE